MNTKDLTEFFLSYINLLEGSKTVLKAQHWGAFSLPVRDKRGIHLYLDEFLEEVSEYQDTIAEASQGLIGQTFLKPSNVEGAKPKDDKVETPMVFANYMLEFVQVFYNNLPNEVDFVGIKSETETFIAKIQKYLFLFNLCY